MAASSISPVKRLVAPSGATSNAATPSETLSVSRDPVVSVTSSPAGGCDANNNTSGGAHKSGSAGTQSSGGRRKISLPSWFRQTSSAGAKSKLTRQHTIDSPGNFHARFLRKQVSSAQRLQVRDPHAILWRGLLSQ